MSFFDTAIDQNGKTVLQVLPEWWYFLAATIPLTAMIFAFWIWWQKQRNAKGGQNSPRPSTDITMERDNEQQSEKYPPQPYHASTNRKVMHY